VLIVRLIPFADPDALALVESFGKAGLRSAGIGLASAARQCPSELAHCLLMLLVPDLGKVAGDLEQHTLKG
jgi:hypothetical protein